MRDNNNVLSYQNMMDNHQQRTVVPKKKLLHREYAKKWIIITLNGNDWIKLYLNVRTGVILLTGVSNILFYLDMWQDADWIKQILSLSG